MYVQLSLLDFEETLSKTRRKDQRGVPQFSIYY